MSNDSDGFIFFLSLLFKMLTSLSFPGRPSKVLHPSRNACAWDPTRLSFLMPWPVHPKNAKLNLWLLRAIPQKCTYFLSLFSSLLKSYQLFLCREVLEAPATPMKKRLRKTPPASGSFSRLEAVTATYVCLQIRLIAVLIFLFIFW